MKVTADQLEIMRDLARSSILESERRNQSLRNQISSLIEELTDISENRRSELSEGKLRMLADNFDWDDPFFLALNKILVGKEI